MRVSPAAERVVEILSFLGRYPDERFTVSALARHLDMNKATAHTLVMTLTQHGFLLRHPDDKSLVSPTSEDSLIAKHIAEHGEGLHHLGFMVDDVDASLARAREQGLRTLGDQGRPGAGDLRVGLLHPKSAYGAIVELIQGPVRS